MKFAEFIADIAIYGLIISLMVHHFFLQSFKVMTRSMEPTLIGDVDCGDRILVKKHAYIFKKPQRWDPIVFFYPQNNRQIFIKRLIGLPGEKVHIRNGEIYIDNMIVRKPPKVVNELLYPLFKTHDNIEYNWEYSNKWQVNAREISVKTKQITWCEYKNTITNRYEPINNQRFFYRKQYAYPVGGSERVGEIRLKFNVSLLDSSGKLFLELREGEYRFLCEMSTQNSGQISRYQSENDEVLQKVNFAEKLQKNQSITFENIDDLITLTINNKVVAKLNYAKKEEKAPRLTYDTSLRWGVSNGSFIFSNIALWRDIYYIAKRDFFGGLTSFNVPNNHYFALGDNPPNSRDSKDWQIFRFFYQNGIAVEGDQKNFPHGETRKFTDIYGFERNIPNDILKEDYLSRQEAPFIPGSYIIGRAIFVFWPITRCKIIY
ncbi:signal peptidase I [Candidatus Uabimicrobium sp. HlEnr_7]|uniref:signal peptidase I n=1 Tax=Candidatus Uabimicrobium helgolandensis TaxID=3095367 RepID=UPI0035583238